MILEEILKYSKSESTGGWVPVSRTEQMLTKRLVNWTDSPSSPNATLKLSWD